METLCMQSDASLAGSKYIRGRGGRYQLLKESARALDLGPMLTTHSWGVRVQARLQPALLKHILLFLHDENIWDINNLCFTTTNQPLTGNVSIGLLR
jgi:hypothetical protein